MMRKPLLTATALTAGLVVCSSAAAQELSFTGLLSSAGLAILPIIGLSILALAVTIERLRNCRRQKIVRQGLAEQVTALWKAGDFDAITRRLHADDSVMARVLNYLITHRHLPAGMASSGAGDAASLALREHQQRIYPLAVTATVAPIIGLLGTVIGMIESFHVIALSGMGDPTLLAGGISKALVNTAAGLSVALPALLIYHFFRNRIASYGLELERHVNRVISECLLAEAGEGANSAATRQQVTHAD